MSDVVETGANTDVSVKAVQNAQAQEQEVKDCIEILKIEYSKFKTYETILEGIQECVEDENNLDPELRAKIKEIVSSKELPQMRLSDCTGNETLLGVPLPTTELTYYESNRLRSCLKVKLKDKAAKLTSQQNLLFHKQSSSIGSNRNNSPLDLTPEDRQLLEYRDKLTKEQELYQKSHLELLELLEELKNIRLKAVPETADKKYEECSLRTHINYLKSELARNKCRIDIFKESEDSFKAYTEILKDLREQQHDLVREIEQLNDLKKKYADVSCIEYDEILKSYLQYKSSLEKRKLMKELLG